MQSTSSQMVVPALQRYVPFLGMLFLAAVLLSIPLLAHGQVADKCTLKAHLTGYELSVLSGNPALAGSAGLDAGTSLPLVPNPFYNPGDAALFCMYSVVKYFANLVFFIIGGIAVLFIAYSAFLFVTSAANPQKRNLARSVMLYAIIGLLIAALARSIPWIVRGIVGFS